MVLALPGLGGAAEAVLGAEDGDDVDLAAEVHEVDLVAQVGQDAGGVGDDADGLAGEFGEVVVGEDFDAGPDAPAAPGPGRVGGEERQGRPAHDGGGAAEERPPVELACAHGVLSHQ